jgi:hypothetical protein
VVAIAAVLARRGANRSLRDAREVAPGDVGDGRPTALWKLPATVAVLAAIFPLLREAGVPGAGWDASLRITGGSAIVGLVQALLIEWIVAAWEGERGVRYYRSKGSRGLRTVLVFAPRH